MEETTRFLIFDKFEGLYLSRHGMGFGWSFKKYNAATLTEEQAVFWRNQLIKIKQRGGFSVLMVDAKS
ncbi:hypothetical protein [Anabaena sp. PCC 7108]|uniref:hypothetical protein n=1 Tax=Anabaena sp. PCC 7108 TaxID=163908 RepID=UPI00034C601A|nr:hypothetical protein [Anabaena sp. PCC 7108]